MTIFYGQLFNPDGMSVEGPSIRPFPAVDVNGEAEFGVCGRPFGCRSTKLSPQQAKDMLKLLPVVQILRMIDGRNEPRTFVQPLCWTPSSGCYREESSVKVLSLELPEDGGHFRSYHSRGGDGETVLVGEVSTFNA